MESTSLRSVILAVGSIHQAINPGAPLGRNQSQLKKVFVHLRTSWQWNSILTEQALAYTLAQGFLLICYFHMVNISTGKFCFCICDLIKYLLTALQEPPFKKREV